jgi:hypothetical protein
MVLRSQVHGCSPRSLLVPLVALSLAWGCSSDAERSPTVNETAGPGVPGPAAPAPGSMMGGVDSPEVGGAGESTEPANPATEPTGSEGIGPIQGIDDGMAAANPSAGTGTSTEPEGEGEGGPGVDPVPVENPFVEDSGLDCTVGALPNAVAGNARLPNPFQKLDGTTIATTAEWRCRRKEIRAMAERYVYGTKPPKPEAVSGSVTDAQLTVDVSNQGNTASFSSTITLPTTGSAPFPAVFDVGGVDRNTFLSQGVAIIGFNSNAVGAERAGGGSQANRQNKTGAFYTLYGNGSPTGLLAAWAWGVSRAIDVIEASDGSVIDKDGLAVMGCSRSGKAAFAIGALDERIALSVPFESGTAGVPIYRGVAQAEVGDNGQPSQSLTAAFGEQAWFGDAFGQFLNSANTIPMDTHEIVAMYAPRGLLVLDNPFIGELTARAAHAAALAGAEVYEALGAAANLSYLSTTTNGQHCLIRPEYQEPLRQAIQKHLFKNEAAAGGVIQANAQLGTANPGDWIDWPTPTLQ